MNENNKNQSSNQNNQTGQKSEQQRGIGSTDRDTSSTQPGRQSGSQVQEGRDQSRAR